MSTKFNTAYDYAIDPGITFQNQEFAAKQSFKEECDINTIMRNFEETGLLQNLAKRDPVYGDFSDPGTFHEAQNIVVVAKEQFAALPARIRERFNNDPANFLEFVYDESNIDELVKMGLATKSEEPQPTDTDRLISKLDELKSERSPKKAPENS